MDKKYLIIIGGIGVLILLALFGGKSNTISNLGSVQRASEYHSTTTDSTLTSWKAVKTSPGTLGQVVITLTSNAGLNFYDATTTVNGGVYGTTTLASFKTTTSGTYIFDSIFTKGLVVETTGAVGVASSSIMYR